MLTISSSFRLTRALAALAEVTVLAALVFFSAAAGASAGLHQIPVETAAALPGRFAGLSAIGVFAVLLAALLMSVGTFSVRGAGVRQTLALCGSLIGFFGASSLFFSFLPDCGSEGPGYALVVPVALMLIFLVALVAALGSATAALAWPKRKPGRALVAGLWLAMLTLFVGVPLAGAWSMVWSLDATWIPGFGIDHLLASRYWSLGCLSGGGACGSAINSIALGVAVAGLAGLLGLALAFYVHRASPLLRRAVALLVCLPMITPPFLIGLGLAQVFGQTGIASQWLELSFGIARTRWFFGAYGVMMAQVLVFFPIVYFLVLNALDSLGRAQIDSAKFLGSSDLDVLKSVSFPAIRDSLAVALLVVFVEALSDVGNPLIIGGKLRVLSTELFYSSGMELSAGEMTGVPALLLTGIALGMAAIKEYFTARRCRGDAGACVSGADRGRCELPAILRWLFGSALLATLIILVTVYAMIGVGAFSDGGMASGAFTLDNFSRGFGFAVEGGRLQLTGSAWDSLIASFSCAFFVAPIGGIIGMSMVWILHRGGISCSPLVESISSYLLCVPSVVIGAGFLLLFGQLGLSNLAAWSLILLAMLIRNLAVCMRFGGVALRRVDRSLGEISGLFGASSLTTFAQVIAPMLRSTFVVCVAYGFVRSMTMLGSVLLLSSAENQVATTYMIDRIGIGEHGVGMAYGVVLAVSIAVVLACGWAFFALRKGAPGLATAIGDLKAAVLLAQKDVRPNRPGF
jgi:iron(III) transport system permease protein